MDLPQAIAQPLDELHEKHLTPLGPAFDTDSEKFLLFSYCEKERAPPPFLNLYIYPSLFAAIRAFWH